MVSLSASLVWRCLVLEAKALVVAGEEVREESEDDINGLPVGVTRRCPNALFVFATSGVVCSFLNGLGSKYLDLIWK
jgi:hypothetical protein